ncbi:MAG: AIM24 family protein [Muribaculaceae bacterium]|nr:AIM24 family protein [Bacteroides sp.]MDE6680288.1 AIM24 family protein [Muribaculaceae bacterium]MDE6843458.1 AIM24 family protein [Muribaculaceae bacterium]
MNCKLVGSFVQHLEVTLEQGEEFFAEKGSLIYIEEGISKDSTFTSGSLGGLIRAKLSGESLFILRMRNTTRDPRKLCIGSTYGLHPVRLESDSLICHRGVYVASSRKVNVSTKLSISGFTGGMGFLLQKIEGTATVFLETKGTPITVTLPPGRTVEIDEDHIIALQGIPESRMSASWSLGNVLGGEGFSMLRVTGPGQVFLSPGKFQPVLAQ